MLPILGLIGAGISAALTSGQATVIGATVASVTVIGANAISKKLKTPDLDDEEIERKIDDDILTTAFSEALKLARKRK